MCRLPTVIITSLFMSFTLACQSPKKLYLSEVEDLSAGVEASSGVFTEAELEDLPVPVGRYIRRCGHLGEPKVNRAEVVWEQSAIRLEPDRPWMRLTTLQHNFVPEPARLAYMRARMMGIVPFEGRDRYAAGQGHMFGTIGRILKVFDTWEREVTLGAAIVVLAEALLIPSYAVQDYIVWEEVDERSARARFRHEGVDVGGTFFFDEEGDYVRFETDERPFQLPDGSYRLTPYSILISSHQEKGGLRIARDVSAVWHLEEGDFEYWRGTVETIRIGG